MNPIMSEQAQKFDTYPKFLRYLQEKDVIESTCAAVKRDGFKGLKEFYNHSRKEK